MPKDKNTLSKRFTILQNRIDKREKLLELSDGEKNLIMTFTDLRNEIWGILTNKMNENKEVKYSSLTSSYVSFGMNIENQYEIFRKLIDFRLNYEKKFIYGRGSTFNRNPILQMFIQDLLEIYNDSINKNKWKEVNMYSAIIGTTRGEEKWEKVSNNTRLLNIDAQNLLFSLSCIDNILLAKELIFDDIPIINNNIFYVCINTWVDIDDLGAGGYILNYEDELHAIKTYFVKHNIRHFIIFNPTKQNYFGHSGNGSLWFRKKSYIASSDIGLAYLSNVGKFMFLNSCDSNIIALELKNTCFDKTIGHVGGLDYKQAVYFAEEFYRLNNPSGFSTNFYSITNQAILSLNAKNLIGYREQSLCFNSYSPYER